MARMCVYSLEHSLCAIERVSKQKSGKNAFPHYVEKCAVIDIDNRYYFHF